jgi:negative regulator of flagellin synthesis FlgM
MHTHGPVCLQGPRFRNRGWWTGRPLPARPRAFAMSSERPNQKASGEAIRMDLVARVRREIAAGTYDTPEKWEAALERLLDRMEREEVSGEW